MATVQFLVTVEVNDLRLSKMNDKRLKAGTQAKTPDEEVEQSLHGSLQHQTIYDSFKVQAKKDDTVADRVQHAIAP